MSDEPAKTCPHCNKDNLVKQISAAGFQLKGTGWYVTDFKNQSKNTAVTEPKKTETKTDSSSEK
jgi:predicted nucleic acid-binding Zn ribbon protein